MSNQFSFENMPEDPEKPIIGIYQKLFEAEKQKKLEREQAKIKEAKPVDNSLLIDQMSGVNNTPHVVSTSHVKNTTTVKSTSHVKITSHVNNTWPEPGKASISANYCKRDKDVINLMPTLSGTEWKVYCYFLAITYESYPSKNICSTTHPTIQQKTGIASNKTVGITVDSLIARGFLKRLLTARRANEKSMYRVFLPCEFNGYTGKTKIESSGDEETE